MKKEKIVPFSHQDKKIHISVSGINHAGHGVGRHNGLAVFIPGAIPEDTVLTEITGLKKNYATGKLLEIISPSPKRKVPPCPAFSSCGGCRLQQVDYREQLSLKTGLVRDSLSRIAGLKEIKVLKTIGMNNPWHYRNKVRFQIDVADGCRRLGFFEVGSHSLVPVDQAGAGCLLTDRDLNETALIIEKLINKYGGQPAGNKNNLFFRHLFLRKALFTGQIMAILATSERDWPLERNFAGELLSLQPDIASLIRNINSGVNTAVPGQENRVLYGQEIITDRLGPLSFRISPFSFYQVNPRQTLVLYQKVLEYAALSGKETIVDAYCGIGTIALFLAGRAKKIYGLEVFPEAVADARRNARLNKINNVDFIAGKVEKQLPLMSAEGLRPDLVILDPPRRGCGRTVLDAIADMQVPGIIYVSCDPGTLARDLKYLTGKGYMVREVQPVDMFPWTHHVECIVLIKRAESCMK